ncbi:HAMP domain-containing histidine kinase [Hansschlegelia quercus]|uniref:histidine kinase n=1 Tax=Hansschlegelia quercus TaxID=2528245 RepID=A0A4V2JEB5_9HYPH|nr:HAMP domain-containing histidine kinase [Hansschlegelia quercus]
MTRRLFRSLRLKLAILVATVVVAIAAAAAAAAWTFIVADRHVGELASAQRRLEHLSTISSRVGDYALIALQTTQSRELQSDRLSLPRKRVQEVFARLDEELAREVARRGDEAGSTLIAARSRVFAFMRARFEFLDRQTLQAIRDARAGEGDAPERVKTALDAFASGFSPALGQAIEEERSDAREAEQAMAELGDRLTPYAILSLLIAALVAWGLYRTIAGPVLKHISQVAIAAGDIARGRTGVRLDVRGHDELSLLMTRFNRMAQSLSRREAQLLAAQLRLQEAVDTRTAELRRANERLSDIDQARRRFFTDVSHELRTPLTVILGEADVTLRGRPDTADLKSALSTIRTRARALHRRVEDLLRVARSESGQLELEFAPVSLVEIAESVVESVSGVARSRGVSVAVDQAGPEPVVEADADWLRQVLEGLVANALRHTREGGTIGLRIGGEGGRAFLSVADDGEGIAETDLPHVFERFYRGKAASDGDTGFGIGLALAKWVVERHGGAIGVESRTAATGEKPGTTVTIRLPAHAPRLAIGAQ